ncbi:MAG TPA: PAC2 family protein [Candidatus Deferrimicrobiaceae bacterium]|nr:PAC2 family protein [Candidatus Deferrimicrobiaceae bacterium]
MVCSINITEKPTLSDPILIEGLPGIGFVANIAALHLIKELKAVKFASIFSSAFQDFAVTTGDGTARSPINELYCVKNANGGRDLIIWFGNTQALTTVGQYELVGKVLDIVQELGCKFVVSIGGFKKDEAVAVPGIYSTATDFETMQQALDLGTKVMVGHVFGIAGLSIGLARIRELKGFSLLVDTPGMNPDVNAARYALLTLGKFLNLNIDLTNLEANGDEIKSMLESFGIVRSITEEKKKEEQQLRWFI